MELSSLWEFGNGRDFRSSPYVFLVAFPCLEQCRARRAAGWVKPTASGGGCDILARIGVFHCAHRARWMKAQVVYCPLLAFGLEWGEANQECSHGA